MGLSAFNVLSLCSGVGGLDLAVRLAVPRSRVVVFVEREAHACEVLARRMEEGILDAAPVWSDLGTFDGKPWHGVVDCVVAGFPCQDISNAGKRAGINGERSGLWWHVLRVVREVGPRYVFLENVGAILVRGLDAVLGSLAESGFDAEWGLFSAKDVGASHLRKRWFCLARPSDGVGLADAERHGWGVCSKRNSGKLAGETRAIEGGEPELGGSSLPSINGIPVVADPAAPQRGRKDAGRRTRRRTAAGGAGTGGNGSDGPRRVVEDAQGGGYVPAARPREAAEGRPANEDAGVAGQLQAGLGRSGGDGLPVFPPGPGDRDAWRVILDRHPEFAPALSAEEEAQLAVRGMADGAAAVVGVDEAARQDILRCLGNGVVPACGAVAFRDLWSRLHGGRRILTACEDNTP